MGPRRQRRIPRFIPELIFIAAAILDIGWLSLSDLGLIPAPPSMTIGTTTYALFASAVVMVLFRIGTLGQRVTVLEQLLATDEADIAALSELPIALHPPGLVVGGGTREPAAGPASPSGASSANSPNGPVATGVIDALAAYRLAGYTDAEAASLVREVLRMQIKEHGGWSP